MKKKNLILSIAIVCFLGCSNKEEPKPAKSKEELLTNNNSKSWKKTAASTNGIPTPIQDCENDDRATFFKDKSFQYTYGSNNCSSLDNDFSTSWTFLSNEDSLRFSLKISAGSGSYTVIPYEYKINELTESKLVLSRNYTISGTTYTTHETYTP